MKKKIILLISGKGTNALNIIKYFINSDSIQVCLVLSNNKNSPLFENLIDYNVPAEYFDIETFDDEVFEKIANNSIGDLLNSPVAHTGLHRLTKE